ncbi:MAG TPA: DUF3857 domain-containing protein [Kofleriaceae bacterium]|jgi:tetratricopeptide (TPR) repeat protein
MKWWMSAVIALAATSVHADPLDKPAFTAEPGELLAAAKAVRGDGIVVLRVDKAISIDDRGLVTERWREVFAVRDKDAADDWSMLGMKWEPWHQDKPQIRARVISSSGRIEPLDLSHVSEGPESKGARRHYDVSLPTMEAGSVVEEEIDVTDRTPIVANGGAALYFTEDNSPHSTHVVLSAPMKRARQIVRALPPGVHAKHETAGGRETWTYVLGPLDESEWEPDMPANVYTRPYFGVTTIASWSAFARDLGKVIDTQIAAHPIELPHDVPAGASLETARAAVAWLHRTVQFDGVAFDDAAPTPAGPAEVVKRGTGNTTELATTLVAVLRLTGARADVVLVRDGPGFDVDPDVPAIDSFDRAIVRVELDGGAVFIDPTVELLRVGQLRSGEQGRRALVLAADTKGLDATPPPKSADNVVREVRTIALADYGTARVTELSRESGVFEAEQRAWYRDSSPDKISKSLKDYIKNHYLSDELETYSVSPTGDLATPFETTVVTAHSPRGRTEREHASAYVYPVAVLGKLPSVLVPRSDGTPAKPRNHDFVFTTPHIYQVENRVVLPSGFTPPAPSPDRTRALGTMQLVEQQRVDGQTLVITFRLDTGKLRLTPAEVEQTRAAVAELRKDNVHVLAEPLGWSLLEKGKYREAVAEALRAAAAQPRDANAQARLAEVLLGAGAGAAARRAARKAVELDPKSADAHVTLGFVLAHDAFGREYQLDFDRADARAELEKAHALDPKHYGAAYELAKLLERGPHGRRYESGADLRAAADAWRAVYALDASADNGIELTHVLLYSGATAEAAKVAHDLDRSDARDQVLVAGTAAAEGLEAGRRVAGELEVGQKRVKLFAGAGGLLFQARRYAEARALLTDGAVLGAGRSELDATFARVAVSTLPKIPTKDPLDVTRAALGSSLDADRPATAFWDAQTGDEIYDSERDQTKGFDVRVLPPQVISDLMISGVELQLEGDAGGWRVDTKLAGQHSEFYVALDRGVAKVIGTDASPLGVGRHVLRLLAKGDDKNAGRFLDWLAKDARPSSRTPYIGAFTAYWAAGTPRDAQSMALAGAFLAGDDADAKRVIPILKRCGATTQPTQLACDLLLFDTLEHAGMWNDLIDAARDWIPRAPKQFETLPTAALAHALVEAGRFDEADRVLAEARAGAANDQLLLIASVEAATARNQFEQALKYADQLAQLPDVKPSGLNMIGWVKALGHVDLPGGLASARAAVRDKDVESEALNTVAVLELESGDLRAAKEDQYKALETSQTGKPDAGAWYVFGMLYEQLGLRDDAIATYRRAKGAKERSRLPSAYDLILDRLKALGAAK